MDDLPLELKQRVCSYLAPKDLKSLRLTSKFYAAATDRYLLPRIFLFNHPDSFQEIRDITNHPDLRHSVTTLVVDTSCLRLHSKYERWARDFADAKTESADQTVARAERFLRRERNREKWTSYQERARAQRGSRKTVLESIALAFRKCPKLSNLVIECLAQQIGTRMSEKQDRFYHDLHTVANERMRFSYLWCLESMGFQIWEILKPVHDVNGTLNSLVLLDRRMTCSGDWNMPTTTIFRNLKHLRYLGWSTHLLPDIVACAPELESIGVDGNYGWLPLSLPPFVGESSLKNLRACSFNHLVFEQDDMVRFLLRHSNTLQDLRITKDRWSPSMDWGVFKHRLQGRLPNLRGLEYSNRHWTWLIEGSGTPLVTGADLLQDDENVVKTGSMEVEDGLWEEYEKVFFPEKFVW